MQANDFGDQLAVVDMLFDHQTLKPGFHHHRGRRFNDTDGSPSVDEVFDFRDCGVDGHPLIALRCRLARLRHPRLRRAEEPIEVIEPNRRASTTARANTATIRDCFMINLCIASGSCRVMAGG